jgi:hypothetical protein
MPYYIIHVPDYGWVYALEDGRVTLGPNQSHAYQCQTQAEARSVADRIAEAGVAVKVHVFI